MIIFGLSEETRHSVLNWIGENIRDGRSFAPDQEHDWVLEGYTCWSRAVVKRWYTDLVGWAIWFYGGSDFPTVQRIWPSKSGAYPWEPNAAFLAPQPLLYEENLLSARMTHYARDQRLENTDWPFAEDPHQRVFVSRCVVEDAAPIACVVHDSDGEWQFIGPVDDPDQDGCKLSCFHCVIERDPTIRELAKLRSGWMAVREDSNSDWTFEEAPDEVD